MRSDKWYSGVGGISESDDCDMLSWWSWVCLLKIQNHRPYPCPHWASIFLVSMSWLDASKMIDRADSRVSFAKVRGQPARLSSQSSAKSLLWQQNYTNCRSSSPFFHCPFHSLLSNYHHSYSNGPPGDTGCMAGLPQGKRIVLRQVYSYLVLLFSRRWACCWRLTWFHLFPRRKHRPCPSTILKQCLCFSFGNVPAD